MKSLFAQFPPHLKSWPEHFLVNQHHFHIPEVPLQILFPVQLFLLFSAAAASFCVIEHVDLLQLWSEVLLGLKKWRIWFIRFKYKPRYTLEKVFLSVSVKFYRVQHKVAQMPFSKDWKQFLRKKKKSWNDCLHFVIFTRMRSVYYYKS